MGLTFLKNVLMKTGEKLLGKESTKALATRNVRVPTISLRVF
jgi:hypothetical protein